MVSEDPWYEIVDGGELEQGDFITNLPTFVPDYTSDIPQKPPEQGVNEHREYKYWSLDLRTVFLLTS